MKRKCLTSLHNIFIVRACRVLTSRCAESDSAYSKNKLFITFFTIFIFSLLYLVPQFTQAYAAGGLGEVCNPDYTCNADAVRDPEGNAIGECLCKQAPNSASLPPVTSSDPYAACVADAGFSVAAYCRCYGNNVCSTKPDACDNWASCTVLPAVPASLPVVPGSVGVPGGGAAGGSTPTKCSNIVYGYNKDGSFETGDRFVNDCTSIPSGCFVEVEYAGEPVCVSNAKKGLYCGVTNGVSFSCEADIGCNTACNHYKYCGTPDSCGAAAGGGAASAGVINCVGGGHLNNGACYCADGTIEQNSDCTGHDLYKVGGGAGSQKPLCAVAHPGAYCGNGPCGNNQTYPGTSCDDIGGNNVCCIHSDKGPDNGSVCQVTDTYICVGNQYRYVHFTGKLDSSRQGKCEWKSNDDQLRTCQQNGVAGTCVVSSDPIHGDYCAFPNGTTVPASSGTAPNNGTGGAPAPVSSGGNGGAVSSGADNGGAAGGAASNNAARTAAVPPQNSAPSNGCPDASPNLCNGACYETACSKLTKCGNNALCEAGDICWENQYCVGPQPIGGSCHGTSDCKQNENNSVACVNNQCVVQQKDQSGQVSNTNCDNGIDCTAGGASPNAVCVGSGIDHAHAYCIANPIPIGTQCSRDGEEECGLGNSCKTYQPLPQFKTCQKNGSGSSAAGGQAAQQTGQQGAVTACPAGTSGQTYCDKPGYLGQSNCGIYRGNNDASGNPQFCHLVVPNNPAAGETCFAEPWCSMHPQAGGTIAPVAGQSQATSQSQTQGSTQPVSSSQQPAVTCASPYLDSGPPQQCKCQNSGATCSAADQQTAQGTKTDDNLSCKQDNDCKSNNCKSQNEAWANLKACCQSGKGWGYTDASNKTPGCGQIQTQSSNTTPKQGNAATDRDCRPQKTFEDCASIYYATKDDTSSKYYNDGFGKCTWDNNGCWDVGLAASETNNVCQYDAVCGHAGTCQNGKCSKEQVGDQKIGGLGDKATNSTNPGGTGGQGGTTGTGYACSGANDTSCASGNSCTENFYQQWACCPEGKAYGGIDANNKPYCIVERGTYNSGGGGQGSVTDCLKINQSQCTDPGIFSTCNQVCTQDCANNTPGRNPAVGDLCVSGENRFYHYCPSPNNQVYFQGYCGTGQHCDASRNQCVYDAAGQGSGGGTSTGGQGSSGGGAAQHVDCANGTQGRFPSSGDKCTGQGNPTQYYHYCSGDSVPFTGTCPNACVKDSDQNDYNSADHCT